MKQTGFRNFLLGCASTLAAAPAAMAQDADTTDTIVVTGFRSSLENSVAVKRDSKSIVEAVSAEDIGKLPDVSIAESLGRLPGLATQRLNGRAQGLSIRGLGPDFSTALLNGREQVTTSDNRGVEFDQYPAELLSAAVVYKTPFSGLVGQGLAGTVDLQTVRPLDKNERIINVNGRYEFNEDGALNPDASGNGYRVTGTIIDQFADDTVGVAIGVAYQSSPSQGELFNAWGYDGDVRLGGAKPFVSSVDLDRLGIMGTLQYQPTDEFNTTLDIFYSDFAEDNPIRGIEFPLGFGGGFQVDPAIVNATTDGGFATDLTFGNVRGVVRNDFNRRRADLFSAGWNAEWDTDTWGLELDVSYSKADRHDDLIESYSGTGYCHPGCGNDSMGNPLGDNPGAADTINAVRDTTGSDAGTFDLLGMLDYGDTSLFVLTDPLGWGAGNDLVQAGFINSPETTDELWHLRGSINRDFDSFISNLEVGVDWSTREKERNIDQQFLTLPGASVSLAGGAVRTLPIPQEALLDEQTGLTFLGLPNQVTYDPFYLLENGFYVPQFVSLSSFSTAQDWIVNEDVFQAWVRADLEGTFIAPFTGNIGVQFVHTDQSSTGFRIPTGVTVADDLENIAETVEDGDSYSDFLPSLNLIWELGENTFLRLGASRTLARARMDQLNASLSLGVNLTALTDNDPNTPVFSAGGGNARLRPYVANQVDLSLEHYFGGAGYIAIAGYYKDLDDFVNAFDGFLFDFTPFVASELTPAQQAQLDSPIGVISGPSNNGSGSIKGFEVALSLPGEIFGEALSPFGLITSTSYTDSEVTLTFFEPTASPVDLTVPGLSKWVVNSTLYFESNGFEARVSHRYRTDFLAEVQAISATRTLRQAKSESIIDAQIGYTFQGDGVLGGTRITFQGLNLTDEPFTTVNNGDDLQVIDNQSFGRTYLIGISKTF